MSRPTPWIGYEPDQSAAKALGRPVETDDYVYHWEFGEEDTALCVLEYVPEEFGGFAHPDHEEQLVLHRVFIGESNIYRILGADQRRRLERMAMDELQERRREHDCEAFDEEEDEDDFEGQRTTVLAAVARAESGAWIRGGA